MLARKFIPFALLMTLGITTPAWSIEPPESLATALNGALLNHPEIISAQATLNQARAEFDKTRLEVVRQIVASWGSLSNERHEVTRLKQLIAKEADVAAKQELENQLVQVQGRIEQIATELHYLTHFTGGEALVSSGIGGPVQKTDPQPPQSRVARRIVEKLAAPTSAEFFDTSLADVVEHIGKQHSINIRVSPELGEQTISLRLADINLAGLIQAIEDASDTRFVIREYGLLLLHSFDSDERGYVEVLKYATDYLGIDLQQLEEQQEKGKKK